MGNTIRLNDKISCLGVDVDLWPDYDCCIGVRAFCDKFEVRADCAEFGCSRSVPK